jgi:transcription termination factor NusB
MPMFPQKLEAISSEFEELFYQELTKIAYIKHMPNGKWTVLSQKGKSLGEYESKAEAVKRLRQVEYFKRRKKKKASEDESYSSLMRELNKNNDERIEEFQKTFKDAFDAAYINGDEKPEEIALEKAKEIIAEITYDDLLFKAATSIEMGDPLYAGKYLSEIIKFLLRRISPEKQAKALDLMKRKVWYINEYDIASKKIPASAAYGQAITLLKHILMEHSPNYIRAVLNSIVRNL